MAQLVSISSLGIAQQQPGTPPVGQTRSLAQAFIIGQFGTKQPHPRDKCRHRTLFQRVGHQSFTRHDLVNFRIYTRPQPPLRHVNLPFHHPKPPIARRTDCHRAKSILPSAHAGLRCIQHIGVRGTGMAVSPETLQAQSGTMRHAGCHSLPVRLQDILRHRPKQSRHAVIPQCLETIIGINGCPAKERRHVQLPSGHRPVQLIGHNPLVGLPADPHQGIIRSEGHAFRVPPTFQARLHSPESLIPHVRHLPGQRVLHDAEHEKAIARLLVAHHDITSATQGRDTAVIAGRHVPTPQITGRKKLHILCPRPCYRQSTQCHHKQTSSSHAFRLPQSPTQLHGRTSSVMPAPYALNSGA